MGHHRAASCSAIPSFFALPSDSTDASSSKSSVNGDELPYPSFCIYSQRALINEYGLESDIIQFLSPVTESLKERLPVFVGVLQSLFGVVNDMPFPQSYEEEEEEESFDQMPWSPFTILGLGNMKLVIWPNMYNNIQEDIIEKDLCLVIIVSSLSQDDEILQNMELIKESLKDISCELSGKDLGKELDPFVNYWFGKSSA